MKSTRQAAEWMLELQRKDLSEARIAAWQQWLQEDPQNQQAFDDLQRIQECIERAETLPWPTERPHGAQPSSSSKRAGFALAAAIAIASIGILLYHYFAPIVLTTSIGELQTTHLADGSAITLGGRSHAQVSINSTRRAIELADGEAYFEVARDMRRPFIVLTGDTQVRALGTAFEVRHSGDHITVAVANGAVEVISNAEAAAARLDAGQQMRIAADRFDGPPMAIAQDAVGSWREGRRQYLDEPLAEVISDLNRYSNHPILIDDAALSGLGVTGTVFDADIDRWLRSLPKALPVTVTSYDDGSVHIGARTRE